MTYFANSVNCSSPKALSFPQILRCGGAYSPCTRKNTPRSGRGRGGTSHGDGSGVDADGDGGAGVRRGAGNAARCDSGGHEGCVRRRGADTVHGRGAVPVVGGHDGDGAGRPDAGAGPPVPPSAAPHPPPRQPGCRHAGGGIRQRIRQSAGTGQRRHAAGYPRRTTDGSRLRRHRQRRAVPSGGAEHRVHPTAAHHRGRRPQCPGLRRAAGHPAGGLAVLGAVRHGRTAAARLLQRVWRA